MFELVEVANSQAIIKVIGVGGCGGNAVENMQQSELEGVGLINANTDAQVLTRSKAPMVLQLGESLTKGLGAGADPEIGRQAAVDDRERIAESLHGADMVFITAGMGGGTGTGAAPVIAELAREMKMLTVAVVTKPFPFEGKKRMSIAEEGIAALHGNVDSLIIIPNEKVLAVMGQEVTMREAFRKADEVLLNAVQGISELITRPGLINVDFADVRTVMAEMGMAMMGSATACGEQRAVEAARRAISSPLLEDVDLNGAKGILVNVTASPDIGLHEFQLASDTVQEYAAADATIVVGVAQDPAMQDDLRVTVVATGLADAKVSASNPKPNYAVSRAATVETSRAEAGATHSGISRAATPVAQAVAAQVDLQAAPMQETLNESRQPQPNPRADTLSVRAKRAPHKPISWGRPVEVFNTNRYADLEIDTDLPAFLRRQAD